MVYTKKAEPCLRCCYCGEWKPLSRYYESNKSRCIDCCLKYSKERKHSGKTYQDVSLFDTKQDAEKAEQDVIVHYTNSGRPKKYWKNWRYCTVCWMFKSWKAFYKNKSEPSWYEKRCKECSKIYDKIKRERKKKKESKIKLFFKKLFRIK